MESIDIGEDYVASDWLRGCLTKVVRRLDDSLLGLLGMNLTGNPWPATLSEVTYGIAAAVLLVLYVVFVRGWLR
jgi:hypothetical protein